MGGWKALQSQRVTFSLVNRTIKHMAMCIHRHTQRKHIYYTMQAGRTSLCSPPYSDEWFCVHVCVTRGFQINSTHKQITEAFRGGVKCATGKTRIAVLLWLPWTWFWHSSGRDFINAQTWQVGEELMLRDHFSTVCPQTTVRLWSQKGNERSVREKNV